MACGFDLQRAGNRRNVGPSPVHLPGPLANRILYGRPCLEEPGLRRGDAESGVNFCQKVPPFLFGDAPLKDSGSAFFIQLSLMDLVGFRSPHYAAGLVLVLGKFLPS